MAVELYVGIHVEGIAGTDGGTATNGDLFVHDAPSFAVANYDLVSVQAEIPQPISSRINWATGDYDLSAVTVLLQATDNVVSRFIQVQTETTALLNAALTSAATSVQIKPQSSIADNSHVWIADELMYLTSRTPSGATHDVFTAARAQAHSTATTHAADDGVFASPHHWAGRVIRAIVVDENGTIDTIWSGFLTHRAVNDSHTDIILHAEELLTALDKGPFNTANRRLIPRSGLVFGTFGTDISGTLDHGDDYVRVVPNNSKAQMIFHVAGGDDIGDLIVPGRRVASRDGGVRLGHWVDATGTVTWQGKARFLYKNRPIDTSARLIPVNTPFYEMVFMHNNGRDTGTFQIRDATGATVGADIINEPWHPASIILAFLLSTGTGKNDLEDPATPGSFFNYDVLAEDLGLGIPAERVNGASFIAAIDEDNITIDQLVIGAGGEEIDTLELIFSIARSYNYVLAPDLNGRIALRKIRTLSISSLSEMTTPGASPTGASAIMLPGDDGQERLPLDFNEDDAVYRLRATVGQNFFDDGITFQTTPQNLTRAEGLLAAGKGDRYDYPTWRPDRKSVIASDLKAKARLRKEAPPTARTRCTFSHTETVCGFTGTSTVAPLGQYVRLCRDPNDDSFSVIGPDGTYLDPNDDANFLIFTGWVSEMTINPGDHNVELGCELFGWKAKNLVRLIAPSGAIGAYTSGTPSVTLDADVLLSKDQDHGFAVGDEVLVRWENGTVWEGSSNEIKSITAIDHTTGVVTLNSAYSAALPTNGGSYQDDFGVPLTYLEVANYDSFTNATWAPAFLPAAWANKRYAYVADASDNLGSADATGDIYGMT